MAKYTFLLPAYKAKFLAETLASIKAQDFQDFKVIVSDDCSPEFLKEIYEQAVGNDARFTYRCNEENIGGRSLVAHWNLLLDMCDTEYLIMASDDDLYCRSFLTEIDALIGKYPAVNVFRARVKRIGADGGTLINEGLYEEYRDQLHFIYDSYRNDFIPCISNYCYRTAALKANGGFVDFPLAWFSDDATNMLMAKTGCVNTRDILFGFRWSESNITFARPSQQQSYKKIEATIQYDKFFKELLHGITSGGSIAEPLMPQRIMLHHERKIQEMSAPYTNMCSLRRFVKYCRILKKQCRQDIKPLVFLYIKKRLQSFCGRADA